MPLRCFTLIELSAGIQLLPLRARLRPRMIRNLGIQRDQPLLVEVM